MTFVVDVHTQVTGRVSVGRDATVEYQATQDRNLLALSISPKAER